MHVFQKENPFDYYPLNNKWLLYDKVKFVTMRVIKKKRTRNTKINQKVLDSNQLSKLVWNFLRQKVWSFNLFEYSA